MTSAARSYLDHNATSPVRPEVAMAVARALELPGNPSSIHAEGRAARYALQAARAQLAALVGAHPECVTFTSGGTEAANAVLSGALRKEGRPAPTRLMISATEHPCVAAGHRFAPEAVEVLPVDAAGLLRLDALAARLDACRDESVLVSVHAANNETGVVQPLAEIVRLARAHGRTLVHSDAVQAVGKIPLDFSALGLDALTLSGHKFAAPKGVGALVLAEGVSLETAFLRGGGQEARLPNTLSFAVPGLEAATALIALDLAGLAVSSGSACASGKVARSPVLAAMGVSPALAAGALRVSFGWNSRADDLSRFVAGFERVVSSLYQRRGQAA